MYIDICTTKCLHMYRHMIYIYIYVLADLGCGKLANAHSLMKLAYFEGASFKKNTHSRKIHFLITTR